MTTRGPYRTRPPAVAGAFYPGTRAALHQEVTARLDSARTAPRARLRGIIAPHAGYVYSGATAAEAFAAARSGGFARALVVGPAHYVAFRGLAVPAHTAFSTPLGEVPVDGAAVRDLTGAGLASADDVPHAPEHAVEVELPFLQVAFGGLPVVPVLFGAGADAAVAEAIARTWTDDTLLVVSSDLSHFEPHAAARAHDSRTAAAIERLALCNSGDTAGSRTSVIGYGAWALVEP